MTATACASRADALEARARQTLGRSKEAIYRMVQRVIGECDAGGGLLLDIGCGSGNLYRWMRDSIAHYVGTDAVRYADFPADCEFVSVDLDQGCGAIADERADVVAAVEIIEHLENPRAFMRELVRVAKPGGWIIITTPNQLSLLSLLTLLVKHRFSAFQDVDYPAHRTALLEVDLRRVASDCGLVDIRIEYSGCGRIAFTPWHYPKIFSGFFRRALSDNLLIAARKPDCRSALAAAQ